MTPLVLLYAPHCPDLRSGRSPLLHEILGDACLLWVLRALPRGLSRICLALPPDHEAIAKAVEVWTASGLLQGPIEFRSVPAPGPNPALDLLREDPTVREAPVLLLPGHRPLLKPQTLQALLDQAPAQLGEDGDGPRSLFVAAHETSRTLEADLEEGLALTDRLALARLQALAQERIQAHWMEEGVTFQDPATTWVGPRVRLAPDVELEPGVRLEGQVELEAETRIGQGSLLRDSRLGKGVEVRPYCVIQGSILGNGCKVGPFAHLREGTRLEAKVHLGNFVETKKTLLKEGAKANHLSYLGDAEVGERTNIGAGCITCNYDGVHKHRTVIGRDVFVGSDCQLVAPLHLGDGAMIAAGTTVTGDVPADALALSRTPLTLREGAAHRFREKLRAKAR